MVVIMYVAVIMGVCLLTAIDAVVVTETEIVSHTNRDVVTYSAPVELSFETYVSGSNDNNSTDLTVIAYSLFCGCQKNFGFITDELLASADIASLSMTQCTDTRFHEVDATQGEAYVAGSAVIEEELLYDCQDDFLALVLAVSVVNTADQPLSEPLLGVTVRVSNNAVSIIFMVTSSISLLCSTMVLLTYLRAKSLRAFPATLVVFRAACDFVFCLSILVLHMRILITGSLRQSCEDLVGFGTHFGLLASVLWYIALIISFFLSVSNPFVKPETRLPQFHAIVWTTSIVFGILTSTESEYREDIHICWNRTADSESGVAGSVYNWLSIYVWVILALVCAVTVSIWSQVRMSTPRSAVTLMNRQHTLHRHRIYVVFFFVVWICAGVFFMALNADTESQISTTDVKYQLLFAAFIGLMGLFDSLSFLVAEWHTITDIWQRARHKKTDAGTGEESSSAFQNISDALRFEFVMYSSHGISESLRKKPKIKPAAESKTSTKAERDPATRGFRLDVSVKFVLKSKGAGVADVPFISYAPGTCRALRTLWGISDDYFQKAFSADALQMQAHFSEGKSGSFFYFTADRSFMVKSLYDEEFETLMHLLPSYCKYMHQQPKSFVCRYMGIFSVEIDGVKQRFVVMNNFLQTPLKIHRIFDLKGSSVGRHTALYDSRGRWKSHNIVMKDNDWHSDLLLPDVAKEEMRLQLERDADFLVGEGVMDYSLLVGVHNCGATHDAKHQSEVGSACVCVPTSQLGVTEAARHVSTRIQGPGAYFFGIIDILQDYNLRKQSELIMKTCCGCHCKDYQELSVAPPERYGKRFKRMVARVMAPQERNPLIEAPVEVKSGVDTKQSSESTAQQEGKVDEVVVEMVKLHGLSDDDEPRLDEPVKV